MFREDLYLSALKTKRLGGKFRWIKEVSSTNDILMDASSVFGEAVAADIQTKGRGRGGRDWFTFRGSLAFSVVLPVTEPSFLMPVNILAGYSVAEALKAYATVKVKWPNDCVIEGGKVCGMLIDTRFKGERLEKAVLGIGVNLAAVEFPEGAATKGVCVGSWYDGELRRETVMAEILNNLEKFMDDFASGEVDIRALWPLYSANINREITMHRNSGVSRLTEKGIDISGSLLAAGADGTEERVSFGEIGYDFGC